MDSIVIPPIRKDVALEADPRGGRLPFAAVDRALGQKVRLDPRGMAVAQALDRPRTIAGLVEALHASTGLVFAPELVVRFVRFLDAHCLLSGERADRRLDALRAADAARTDAIGFVDGTSHACVGCGHSCEAHDVGPIAEEHAAAARAVIPGARFVIRQTGDPETTGHYCGMTDDRCGFLRADNLCAIHAAAGVESKPTDCRVFPLAFTATPVGIVAGVRLECRSYIASKRNGGALADRGPELRELAGRLRSMNEVPPLVRLDASATLPFVEYLALERALIDQVAGGPPIVWSGLLALRDRAVALVDAARAADVDTWVLPPEPAAPGGVPREATILSVVEACDTASRMNAAAGNPLRAERLARVSRALARLAAGPPVARTLDPEEDELLRDHLRQSIHLKDPLLGPHLRFGIGVLALSVVAAIAGLPEADHLNGALADTLKALRTGPVASRLQTLDEPISEWFFERLGDWILAREGLA